MPTKITDLPQVTELSELDVFEVESFLTSAFVSSQITLDDFLSAIFLNAPALNLVNGFGGSPYCFVFNQGTGFEMQEGGGIYSITVSAENGIYFANSTSSQQMTMQPMGGSIAFVDDLLGGFRANGSSGAGTCSVTDGTGSGLTLDGMGGGAFSFGFTGTVSPVTSITVVGGIVTDVS